MIFRRRREPDYRVRLWEDSHDDWQYKVTKGRERVATGDTTRKGERGYELAKSRANEAIQAHAARQVRRTESEYTVPAVQARQEVLERDLLDGA